ncbi:hypothetical protein CL622_02200 [archaeon]|nr:hypothetical protein [archaeon]
MVDEIKKSYNPFKMWGSYVGAIFGGLSSFIGGGWVGVQMVYLFVYNLELSCKGKLCDGILILFFFLPLIIIGFLLGWGIHSIIRKLKAGS